MSRKAKPKPKRDVASAVQRTASEIVRERMLGYAPGRAALYSGTCEGGPHHGKPLYHGEPVMRIARHKISLKMVTWFGNETDEIRLDEYRHEDGRWMWIEVS